MHSYPRIVGGTRALSSVISSYHSRACLQDQDLAPHRLVLYSSDDPRKKANAALLMALYVVSLHKSHLREAYSKRLFPDDSTKTSALGSFPSNR